jgi:hypothetical protein
MLEKAGGNTTYDARNERKHKLLPLGLQPDLQGRILKMKLKPEVTLLP